MPHARPTLLLALALAAAVPLSVPVSAQTNAPMAASSATVDADAVAALARMGKALRALPQFRMHATTSTDYVLDDGQKLALAGTVDYKVNGPDRFFVDIQSEQQHRQLFYDGKRLTIYAPRLKYYATLDDLNRSSQALLAESASRYGLEFPLADLFLWGTPAFPTDGFQSALRVDSARIDGDATQHYAFRQPGVDWQVWISDATALPRQLIITSHADPALPSYQATLQWDTRRPVNANELAFNPGGATRIVFVPVALAAQDTPAGGN
ncbi:DUF2092 domain-containing protein [Stenotrophomonas rhizophila]